jgi:hypothetical protein
MATKNEDNAMEVLYSQSSSSRFQPRATPPVHLRQPEPPGVRDKEYDPVRMVAVALTHLRQVMERLPVMVEDNSRPVDEYQPAQTLGVTPTESTMEVQPQWETPEIIKAIVITGPTGTVTVQLGDRTWALTIPASGIIVVSPLLLILNRSDRRILTAGTPGDYSLELMGHADSRGQLV